MPDRQNTHPYSGSLKSQALVGLTMLGLFFGAGGYWAGSANLAGAVVASGQLVVVSNVKKVQHPTGGIVSELMVKDGDHVEAGQLLLRLDQTITAATLSASSKKLNELNARAARLEAERYGYRPLRFPQHLVEQMSNPDIAQILETEDALYNARKDAHAQRKSRLNERLNQLKQEIIGLQVEQVAREKLEVVTLKELEGLRHLDQQKLVQYHRLSQVEKEAIDLERRKGQLLASLAQAEGRIVETELQIVSLDDELRVETTNELREIQAEIAQEEERRISAMDQQKRIEIRAPSAGRVHQSIVHTVGGVVAAGDTIMLIVPQDEDLALEVRINPSEIDQVHPGQEARVQFMAFNRRTTPQLTGTVSRMGADVIKDPQTGSLYYTVRIAFEEKELERLSSSQLMAGMLAEAFIKTTDRTPIDFLTRPIKDQIARSMNER